jgi:hypothetical protein
MRGELTYDVGADEAATDNENPAHRRKRGRLRTQENGELKRGMP